MAGDWIKMRTSLLTNPKVNGIARFLEDSRDVARSLSTGYSGTMNEIVTRNVMRHVTVSSLLVVWGAANEHTKDGVFTNADLSDIDDMVGIPGFGKAMQAVGWADFDEESFSVTLPNFTEYNTSGASRSANAKSGAERQREYRQRKKATDIDASGDVTGDVTRDRREEKRREEKEENTLSGKPDSADSGKPNSDDVKASNADAREVLAHLNNRTGCSYRAVESNLSLIRARLAEGYSVADVKAVIDAKAAQWGPDDEMSKYLRPETLFGARKFSGYVGQVERKAPGAGWWLNAGFSSPFEAENAGCSEKTAYLWQDGHRLEATA